MYIYIYVNGTVCIYIYMFISTVGEDVTSPFPFASAARVADIRQKVGVVAAYLHVHSKVKGWGRWSPTSICPNILCIMYDLYTLYL